MSAAAGQNAPGRKSAADRPPVLELTGVTKFRTARRSRQSLPHYPPK